MTWWTDILTSPGGIGATLGAGSSPFVIAILTNRLITRGHYLDDMKLKDKEIAEVRANAATREEFLTKQLSSERDLATQQWDRTELARSNEQKAKEVERDRADKLATSLAQLTSEFGAVAVHALESLPKIGDTSAP